MTQDTRPQVKIGQIWTNGTNKYKITDISRDLNQLHRKCSAMDMDTARKLNLFGYVTDDNHPDRWSSEWHVLQEDEASRTNKHVSNKGTGPIINDHICPTCKNNRCTKSEVTCWSCGHPL